MEPKQHLIDQEFNQKFNQINYESDLLKMHFTRQILINSLLN